MRVLERRLETEVHAIMEVEEVRAGDLAGGVLEEVRHAEGGHFVDRGMGDAPKDYVCRTRTVRDVEQDAAGMILVEAGGYGGGIRRRSVWQISQRETRMGERKRRRRVGEEEWRERAGDENIRRA